MKTIKGKVTSLKNINTARVVVSRKWKHPLYLKYVKRSKSYLCHYEMDKIELKLDDMVEIEECKPISKKKHFKIVKVFKK